MEGKCLQTAVICQATDTRKDTYEVEKCIRITENDFKTHYRNHTKSLRNQQSKCSTERSKSVWFLKDKNMEYSIKWKIIVPNNVTAQIKDVIPPYYLRTAPPHFK